MEFLIQPKVQRFSFLSIKTINIKSQKKKQP